MSRSTSPAALWVAAGVTLLLGACAVVPSATGPAGDGWAAAWTAWTLPGKQPTRYETRRVDERIVVKAQSDRSASMLRRSLRIEPQDLGTIRFAWRVDRANPHASTAQRDREDAPARIVLAFEGDVAKLPRRTRMMFEAAEALTGEAPPYATLMYVWDDTAEPGALVVNPRSDRIRKLVVESGPAALGRWREYARDIRADYLRAYGEEPGALVGVALMTDSDNTGWRAETMYGEVSFLPRAATH